MGSAPSLVDFFGEDNMSERTVLVTRGCIDVPDVRALTEQRRLNPQSFGARTFALGFTRRYRVGERLELEVDEAERLAKAGIVSTGSTKIVPLDIGTGTFQIVAT
jgi:hypothetical protein